MPARCVQPEFMKVKAPTLSIGVLILTIAACRNYSSKADSSPSGKYAIFATVNRTDRSKKDYASVIIHLLDNKGKELSTFDTRAGDFSSWEIGWAHQSDTIVLFSGDIGNYAYKIQNDSLIGIKLTDDLNERARELKAKTP